MEIDLFSMGYGNSQHNARKSNLRIMPDTEEGLTMLYHFSRPESVVARYRVSPSLSS